MSGSKRSPVGCWLRYDERREPGLPFTHDAPRSTRPRLSSSPECSDNPAARLLIYRLRRKFRQLLEAEIARTVSDPAEIPGELVWLRAALAEGRFSAPLRPITVRSGIV